MLLIWTRNKSPLSRLIRWGLREPVSHFAIVFDESLVFHSNLLGVHLEWFNTFKKKQEIVYTIPLRHTTLEEQEVVFRSIVDRFNGKMYDYGAFLYLCYRVALKRLFGKPIPAHNRWNDQGKYLCHELAEGLPGPFRVENLEIITPYQLYEIYKSKLGNYYPISTN